MMRRLLIGAIGFVVWSILARIAEGFFGAMVSKMVGVPDVFLLGWIPYLAVFIPVYAVLGTVFCWLFLRFVRRPHGKGDEL